MKRATIRFYIQIYLLIFFVVSFIHLLKALFTKNVESMITKRNIVVLGDSVFDNRSYVSTTASIPYLLGEHEYLNAKMYASDGAKIEDLNSQLQQCLKEIDDNNETLFISIGGNNILTFKPTKKLSNNEQQKQVSEFVNIIFDKYRNVLKNYDFKCNLVLCNIYVPYSEKNSIYEKCIHTWNKKLSSFAESNNYKVMKLDKLLYKKEDFADNLEPSKIGGEKIVKNMISFIN
jgi:lysophospholipase L1-like esterase